MKAELRAMQMIIGGGAEGMPMAYPSLEGAVHVRPILGYAAAGDKLLGI
jgi:hypothetical protein